MSYLEPEVWQLNKFVLPLIHVHWENVAYISLHYDVDTVEGIEAKHKSDTKKCCQEMFKHWLRTSSKVGPKTWETLLRQLREVEELTANVEKIEENVLNM